MERRHFLGGATGALLLSGTPAMSCGNSLDRYIASASSERSLSGQWAVSVAPNAFREINRRIEDVLNQIQRVRSNQRADLYVTLVDLTNAAGSALIFALGVTGTATAVPAFIGGLALTGGVMVAKAVVSPADALGPTFLIERPVQHLGILMEETSDTAIAITNSARNYSALASKALSGLGALIAFWNFAGSLNDYLGHDSVLDDLEARLMILRNDLDFLQNHANAQQFRDACMAALIEDLIGAQNQCLLNPLD